MRKKYLSALLFGALLVTSTGTFTSCKDYDDDINNLQEQIDKLATKEDMEAKLSQMQSAIDAAKTTAEEALAKAEAAGDSEEVNDLKERIAALEEAMKKVETLKAEIKTMVDDELADFREEMKEFMKEVEELTGYSLTMITEISFVYASEYEVSELDPALDLNYGRVNKVYVPNYNSANGDIYVVGDQDNNHKGMLPADSYEFGAGMTGAFTINAGDVNTVTDNMLVKVAPVDAAISSDMVSLVNGKGENIDNYVNLSVSAWSGDIKHNYNGSRATSQTGLYKVGVQLKNDVDFESFEKLVLASNEEHDYNGECKGGHDYKMFSLAVTDAEKSRTVSSDYAVSMHVLAEKEAKKIAEKSTLTSSSESGKAINEYKNAPTNEDSGCFQIVAGENFTLRVDADNNNARIMASYVVVDIDNPGLTAQDKVAVNSMDFSGTENVVKGDGVTHTLKVTGAAGVTIPMKLVTIDYLGYVKENIFWVRTATPAIVTAAYEVTTNLYIADDASDRAAWTPTKAGLDAKAFMQPFTIPAAASKYTISITAGEKYANDKGVVVENNDMINKFEETIDKKNLTSYFDFYKEDKTTTTTANVEIAYAVFKKDLNLKAMREDKTYTGSIKFYDKDGNYLGLNTIKLTKKLPTDVPANFSAKTNSINNGVMAVYPKPQTGNNTVGNYVLSNSFLNWTKNTGANEYLGYWLDIDKFTFNTNPILGTFGSDASTDPQIKDINVNVLGNDNAYQSIVSYNYGDIKYVPTGHGVVGAANHTVEWSTKFAMKFGYWPDDCEYSWTGTPEVIYGVDQEILGKANVDKDGDITSYDNVIKVLSPYGVEVNPFSGTTDWAIWAPNLLTNGTITLVTYDDSGKKNENEFFTANFAVKSVGTNASTMIQLKRNPSTTVVLRDNVETTVVINFTDKFGKERHVEALKFIMKKSAK